MEYNPKVPDSLSRGGRRGSHTRGRGSGRHVGPGRGGAGRGGSHKKPCGSDFSELVAWGAAMLLYGRRRG